MRLIHTADLHLDACYAAEGLPPSVGNRLRQSAREVFHRIVLRAGDWPADALLIAGNFFEGMRVTRDTVHFIISELQAIAHVPVFIAPGPCDPFTASSPYATENWPRNVTMFRTPEWTRVPVRGGRLTVHGLGHTGDAAPDDAFRRLALEPAEGEGVHVAVSHAWDAAFVGESGQEKLGPMHYCALGGAASDAHAVKGAVRYCGSPQAMGFVGQDAHQFLEVEILAGSAHVRAIPSSRVSFVQLELDCADKRSVDDVAKSVHQRLSEEALPVVLRLHLTGSCAQNVRGNLRALHDALAGELLHVQVIDDTQSPSDDAALAGEESSLGAFLRTLNEELSDCSNDERRALLRRARDLGMASFTREACEVKGLETV